MIGVISVITTVISVMYVSQFPSVFLGVCSSIILSGYTEGRGQVGYLTGFPTPT